MPTDDRFSIPEPYDVDPASGVTKGRLLLAAVHGDRRAKATLAVIRKAEQEAAERDRKPPKALVDQGRHLYRDRHPSDTDDPDAA